MKLEYIGGIMVDYKEIFKRFYENSISLRDNFHNYNLFIERGLCLCILKKYITTNDIPLGEELSSEKIFKILNIDTDNENIDLNLFNNYIILKLERGIKILSLPKRGTGKMTQVCFYDGVFVMSNEYNFFEPLSTLSNDVDIPLYLVESNALKSRFKDLADYYIDENLNELILLGCIDKNNIISSNFNLNSKMKKIISASHKENKSIYDYLKDDYISKNLTNYIKKYPSTKENKSFVSDLLLKYKKAELVPYSEILTDKVKNDFKVNIKKSISHRRELEKFIYKGWIDKHNYDLLLDYNKESIEIVAKLNSVIENNALNIVMTMDGAVLLNLYSDSTCEIFVNMMTTVIKIGNFNFKKLYPVIEYYDFVGPTRKNIKLETTQERKNFFIYKDGIEIYPCREN